MDSELFPDPDRPLFTPDTILQGEIVERIKQAKKEGRQVHHKGRASNPEEIPYGLPMGQRPQVSDEKLGCAWGMSRISAMKLVKNPGDMNPFQVDEMCNILGVTRAWLRGLETVNAYGVYEESAVVADLYDSLTPEDKALVCRLLGRIAGADIFQRVKSEHQIKRNQVWYDRHKNEANQIRQRARNAREVAEVLGLRGRPDVDLFLRSLPTPKRD